MTAGRTSATALAELILVRQALSGLSTPPIQGPSLDKVGPPPPASFSTRFARAHNRWNDRSDRGGSPSRDTRRRRRRRLRRKAQDRLRTGRVRYVPACVDARNIVFVWIV